HRLLHSFPTRRSSDLAERDNAQEHFTHDLDPSFSVCGERQRYRTGSEISSSASSTSRSRVSSVAKSPSDTIPTSRPSSTMGRRRDRKSTRLNSSHVSI